MATQTRSPQTMADNNAIGTITWNNPNNAKVSDNVYSSAGTDGYPSKDNVVKLIKSDGTLGSTNKASATGWVTTLDTYYSYGNSSDLWSENWTSSDINNSNFGVVLSTIGTSTSHYLQATNFGFSIPSGSTINGIQVDIERHLKNSMINSDNVDHIRITVDYTEAVSNTTNFFSLF